MALGNVFGNRSHLQETNFEKSSADFAPFRLNIIVKPNHFTPKMDESEENEPQQIALQRSASLSPQSSHTAATR